MPRIGTPSRTSGILGLLSKDESALLGYLIYYVEGDSAVCADVFVPRGREDLGPLLSRWTMLAWESGQASLSISCSDPQLTEALDDLGFVRRTASEPQPGKPQRHERCKTIFVHERTSLGEPAVEGWYYTGGDSPY